jgi:hypothetical protein
VGGRENAPVNPLTDLLAIWGDPSHRSSYTIDLFPLSERYSQRAVRQVLVYARDYPEALEIARREGQRLELGPRSANPERLN